MTETEHKPTPGMSLATRIQSTVLALTIGTYIVGLLTIGLPLREMTIRHLAATGEQEASALQVALQDYASQRDYASIEQVLTHHIKQINLRHVRFENETFRVEKNAPARTYRYPVWFAEMLAINPAPIHTQVIANNREVGKLSLLMDARNTIENLWTLTWMFTSLCLLGMFIVGLMLHRMLRANLSGLYDLQQAARTFEQADFSIRLPMTERAPPEIQQTKRAFNHMAYKLNQLLSSLERKQDDLHNEKRTLARDDRIHW